MRASPARKSSSRSFFRTTRRRRRTAYFAISNAPVNFHDFASLFRDALHTPEALFFDGHISRLYAPDLGRDDFGFAMGPMVGLAVPAD